MYQYIWMINKILSVSDIILEHNSMTVMNFIMNLNTFYDRALSKGLGMYINIKLILIATLSYINSNFIAKMIIRTEKI